MKRLLTLLFLLAGIALAHSAYAQSDNGGKKKKKKAKKEEAAREEAPSGGAPGDIAIDEGGAPKGKKTTTATQGDTIPAPKKDKQESAERAPAPPSGSSPEPIAIDEGGAPKVKKPATAAGDKPSSDSVIKSPANMLGRPDE